MKFNAKMFNVAIKAETEGKLTDLMKSYINTGQVETAEEFITTFNTEKEKRQAEIGTLELAPLAEKVKCSKALIAYLEKCAEMKVVPAFEKTESGWVASVPKMSGRKAPRARIYMVDGNDIENASKTLLEMFPDSPAWPEMKSYNDDKSKSGRYNFFQAIQRWDKALAPRVTWRYK